MDATWNHASSFFFPYMSQPLIGCSVSVLVLIVPTCFIKQGSFVEAAQGRGRLCDGFQESDVSAGYCTRGFTDAATMSTYCGQSCCELIVGAQETLKHLTVRLAGFSTLLCVWQLHHFLILL